MFKIIIKIVILFLVFCLNCSFNSDSIAGGSTDTELGGTVVSGLILNSLGAAAPNCEVKLIPENYNPLWHGSIPDSLIDTTNSEGIYFFKIANKGKYNIQALHLNEKTRLLITDITVLGNIQDDTVFVDGDSLKEVGTIQAFLPDTIDTTTGYVFIKGTTVYKKFSEIISDSNGLSIILDSVPVSTLSGIRIGTIGYEIHHLFSDTVSVSSDDTSKVKAFTFWANYKKSNSGLPDNGILHIFTDTNKDKWFSTSEGGCVKYTGKNWIQFDMSNSSLPSNSVQYINRDNQDVLWFATTKGIATLDGNNWNKYTSSNSELPSDSTRMIVFDKQDNLWIATEDKGLVFYDRTNWKTYDSTNSLFPSNKINALAIDNDNIKWCATPEGLVRIDGDSIFVYDFTNPDIIITNVYYVFVDSKNTLWITYVSGVASFDGSTWTEYPIAFPTVLAEDNYGNIWCGTVGDIFMFNGSDWIEYNVEDYIELGRITPHSIVFDDNNDVWLGDYIVGVIVFGPTIK